MNIELRAELQQTLSGLRRKTVHPIGWVSNGMVELLIAQRSSESCSGEHIMLHVLKARQLWGEIDHGGL
ncbi:hypothetical protein D9M71_676850 [compost metagenome]